MKLKARTIKTNKRNHLRFPDTIFVHTDIEISLSSLVYKGIAIDKLNDSNFISYKNCSVKLDILKSSSILFYILSFISDDLTIKAIKKYLDKYEESPIVNTQFDYVNYGEKLGFFKFDSRSSKKLYSATCAAIVNYLVDNNFDKNIVTNCMHSFPMKAYATVKFTKIS